MGQLIAGFIILMIIFIPLERLFPLRRYQKVFRKGWFTDVLHFFISRVLILAGTYAAAVILYIFFHRLLNTPFQQAVAQQPQWLQFIEGLLIGEISFYWIHRLAHTWGFLWKFHAIHHSSPQLDWLASVRLHPVEMIVANLGVGIPLVLMGFSSETFGVYTLFSTLLAILVHSNVRLAFRSPLRWLIPTPQFHHWHHANEPQAINKNFGSPLVDLLFGTAYLPRGLWPRRYGVDDRVPDGYLGQLAYPFRKARPAPPPPPIPAWQEVLLSHPDQQRY